MTAQEFEERIVNWARGRAGVSALIQIGSRTMSSSNFDEWSDWDFHLISHRPRAFYGTQWVTEIATPWCVHSERSIRGSIKISAVFEGALEADFVPLSDWQMRIVYSAMRYPALSRAMPSRLRRGIAEIREILLNSGYKVLVGDRRWEKRLKALGTPWPPVRMSAEEFNLHVQAFWQKAVWIAKKIARPEPRSAMHWMHKLILEHVYALLEEEAWLTGRSARPEALKSEKWLDTRRLQQTAIETGIDPAGLAKTLLLEIELFKDVCASVASRQGFAVKDHGAVKAWLEAELKRIAAESIAG